MADGSEVKVGTLTTAQGVPTGMHEGIGAAMRCESATACNGFTVQHVPPLGSTFRPSTFAASTSCQAAYFHATGIVTVATGGC